MVLLLRGSYDFAGATPRPPESGSGQDDRDGFEERGGCDGDRHRAEATAIIALAMPFLF